MRSVQQTYQKKTQLQHILLRPDTYVGSIEMQKSTHWVLADGKLVLRQIMYVPALYKIFDEVMVNAADNYHRDHKMNLLKVQITAHFISVHNNGQGIPVSIHKNEKVYVPQLIFGHLLTGSNYNDDEKKVVGGRNGYGAKLANIFSNQFSVECGDGAQKKKFYMKWQRNMTIHSQAEIVPYSGKDYTVVKFHPQFRRFGMQSFDEDIMSLLKKRVYDMAGLLPRVKVHLNGEEIQCNNFLKYVGMYLANEEVPLLRDDAVDNERWQIVVSTSDGQFKQVSFVNGICTSKGGTHVNYITDQIVERIQEKLKKKDKNLNIKAFQIKAHLWVFINCLIQNPAFDSQTKQNLILKQSLFGSHCQLSEKLIKAILGTGIVDDIFNEAKAKELNKLAKMTGGHKKSKLTGIPKLEDANDAGTRNSQRCTLILTEGDSAKSLAMAGIEVIGRDHYGVFPLKGKLLNVREANSKTLLANEEVQNLMKIVGLQINKKYQDTKTLRYGSIMIMSDQDTDGSHIKGLVINFIHHFWPSLFKTNGFLKQFITPLLKATKGKECVSFYTMQDYKDWSEGIANASSWKVKYYKGLGTSTDKQAMEYFQNLRRNKIEFKYEGEQDDESMELIFNKKNANKRKQWLSTYDPRNVMVYDRPQIRYKQFVDKQFIHFSNEDNNRSIASLIDGFKPGQRKIIFSCFKRNLKQEIKVAQLAGYVAEHSAYHHGEMSLTMTIVNMAQNFVGSNNINLLMPNGQFGTRNQGGKDHASARYIFTNLNKVTRMIFPESDDHSLTYIEDDGQLVEPQFYVPIIPMILVNGCQGIGSGWSTYIPNHSPREITAMILKKLEEDQPFHNLQPWYKGFMGEINLKEDQNFQVKGFIEWENEAIVHIKELPVQKWTKDYKVFIDTIMEEGESKIIGLKQYHTKNRVHFQLEMNSQFSRQNSNKQGFWEKFFKISTNISMQNLVGFDKRKMLKKANNTSTIMEQFYEIRMEYYQKRKQYLISRLVRQLMILDNKERFIVQVVQEKLIIRNVKKIKIVQLLKARGFIKFRQFPAIKSTKMGIKEQEKQLQIDQKDEATDYNYLLSMPLWSLSYEKVQEIQKNRAEKKRQLEVLEKTQIKKMWANDLRQFIDVLDKVQQQQEEDRLKGQSKLKDKKTQKAKKKKDKNQKTNKVQKKDKQKNKKVQWQSQSETDQKTPITIKIKQKKIKQSIQKTKEISPKKTVQGQTLIERIQREMIAAGKISKQSIIVKPSTKRTINNVYQEDNEFKIKYVSKKGGKKTTQIDSDSDEWKQ